jgi:hypothetical protein
MMRHLPGTIDRSIPMDQAEQGSGNSARVDFGFGDIKGSHSAPIKMRSDHNLAFAASDGIFDCTRSVQRHSGQLEPKADFGWVGSGFLGRFV